MTLFPTYLELVLVSLFREIHALVVNKGVTLPLAIIKARVSTVKWSEHARYSSPYLDTTSSNQPRKRCVAEGFVGMLTELPRQLQVIQRLVEEKKNALLLLPTGGGKSLCFQIPALCFEVRRGLCSCYKLNHLE